MADDKKVRIDIPIVPSVDKKASRAAMAEIRQLERELGSIKVSFNDVVKSTRDMVSELRKMPSDIEKAGKSIQRPGGGRGGPRKESVNRAADRADKKAEEAAQFQINSQKRIEAFQKQRMEAVGKIFKGIPDLLNKNLFKTAAKSMASHGVTAASSTAGIAKEGGGTGAAIASALAKAGTAVVGVVGVVTILAKILSLASENQAKLNRSLLEGSGTASDFGSSVEDYRGAVRELNEGILKSNRSFLQFGSNSEKAAKSIGAFSKETTGSIIQTRNELASLGGSKGLGGGVEIFRTATESYSRALGMSTEQTGELMGKMSHELGRNAKGSISALENIVQAAAKSNMPMAKFMDIFHQVIPGVELYQNRLEELTGTIKMLSKTMSPKDVKGFMDAFAKGFDGKGIKDRLKTALIVGIPQTSKILADDFEAKARSMADQFGLDPEAAVKATQGGEKAMAAFIAAQRLAGKNLTGVQAGNLMKNAHNEGSRRAGGALNVAHAMKGGGMMAAYKLMERQGSTFVKGDNPGLQEVVQSNTGISSQEMDAIMSIKQNAEQFKAELQASGGQLSSKSMQKGLESVMSDKLRKQGKELTPENLTKAIMSAGIEDFIAAGERSNYAANTQEEAVDLAKEQYNVTSSLGDKLENVVGWLLEQILSVLNSTLDVLNDTLMWIMGDKDAVKEGKRLGDLADAINTANKDRFAKKGSEGAAEMVKMGAEMVASGKSLVQSGVIDKKDLDSLSKDQVKEMMSKITNDQDAINSFANRYDVNRAANGDKGGQGEELLSYLGNLKGVNGNDASMRVVEYMAQVGKISKAAVAASDPKSNRRPEAEDPKTVEKLQKALDDRDLNEKFKPLVETQRDQLKIAEEAARSGMDLSSKQNDKSKTATTEAMTTALAQQAAKEAYIDADPTLRAHKGELLSQSGLMLPDQMRSWLEDQNNPLKPGYANGGPIDYDQVARIHKGEFVVPKGGMLVSGGGGGRGPKIGTMNLTVNAKTDATAAEIAQQVHSIFSRE